jgi:GT2 family glycosyltransferase
MSKPLVSVVIVTFESEDDIVECFRSVLASDISLEIIIIDNASSDHTVERIAQLTPSAPSCRLICNRENVGFAKAVNQGIGVAQGQYFLVMNPDCTLQPDTVRTALAVIQRSPDAALAGCMLLNIDGTEQAGGRRYFPTPWRALVRVLKLHRFAGLHPRFHCFLMNREPVPSRPVEVDAISGAFMLVRRSAIDQVGVLDEGYFMHCEDLDWCVRFGQAGWKVLFVPQAQAVHKRGRSSRSRPIQVELHKHRGMIRYYRKFLRHRYPEIMLWGVTVAVWVRFITRAISLLLSEVRPTSGSPSRHHSSLENARRYAR